MLAICLNSSNHNYPPAIGQPLRETMDKPSSTAAGVMAVVALTAKPLKTGPTTTRLHQLGQTCNRRPPTFCPKPPALLARIFKTPPAAHFQEFPVKAVPEEALGIQCQVEGVVAGIRETASRIKIWAARFRVWAPGAAFRRAGALESAEDCLLQNTALKDRRHRKTLLVIRPAKD